MSEVSAQGIYTVRTVHLEASGAPSNGYDLLLFSTCLHSVIQNRNTSEMVNQVSSVTDVGDINNQRQDSSPPETREASPLFTEMPLQYGIQENLAPAESRQLCLNLVKRFNLLSSEAAAKVDKLKEEGKADKLELEKSKKVIEALSLSQQRSRSAPKGIDGQSQTTDVSPVALPLSSLLMNGWFCGL